MQINTRLTAVLATSGDREQGRKNRVKDVSANSDENVATDGSVGADEPVQDRELSDN